MNKINLNPKGIKACDCVIRAIAYATEQPWDKVYTDLTAIGFKMKRLPVEKQVYEKYLEMLGWEKNKQPRKHNGFKYTINEMIENMNYRECCFETGEIMTSVGDRIIISVANHLTCIAKNEYGNFEIVDTWDCGRKTIGNFWTKGGK